LIKTPLVITAKWYKDSFSTGFSNIGVGGQEIAILTNGPRQTSAVLEKISGG